MNLDAILFFRCYSSPSTSPYSTNLTYTEIRLESAAEDDKNKWQKNIAKLQGQLKWLRSSELNGFSLHWDRLIYISEGINI